MATWEETAFLPHKSPSRTDKGYYSCIVASDKIVVHAAVGDVISMLFSVSLACDYAIIPPAFGITGVPACIRPREFSIDIQSVAP